jgi:fibronectin-binding autotransporter adhesin
VLGGAFNVTGGAQPNAGIITKVGQGTLAFGAGSSITVGGLNTGAPATLHFVFDNSEITAGSIVMNGTSLQFDIFSGGLSDTLKFTGSNLNTVDMQDITLVVRQIANDEGDTFDINNGDSWQLFDWQGLQSFNLDFGGRTYDDIAMNLPTLREGLIWDIDRLINTGHLSVTSVPEPGRVLLLLLGIMILAMRRRRKGGADA